MYKKPRTNLGPLTEMIQEKKDQDDPPALINEWEQALKNRGDAVVFHAGTVKKNQDKGASGWSSLWVSTHNGGEKSDQIEFLDTVNDDLWERLLTAAAHKQRFPILKALSILPRTSGELANLTSMQGGVLYYHLRELMHAGLVEQTRKTYVLTSLGLQFILVVASLLHHVEYGTDGKLLSTSWIEAKAEIGE